MKIDKGRRVKMRVELAVVGGQILEKSVVEYIHGAGTMLSGLEGVLSGLEKGARRSGVLKAIDAFGNPASHPTKVVKSWEFPDDVDVKVGNRFAAQGQNDLNVWLHVMKIDGDDITVRMVHPLADKDIRYDVEVLQVTDPRPPPMPAAALKLEEG